MTWNMIFGIVFLQLIVFGILIFFLRHFIVTWSESSKNRLNLEADKALSKQGELAGKIKEADDELAKRQAEARQLSQKMLTDAEQQAKTEREQLIQKARLEGEEIITKAQDTREKIRKELEKDMTIKSVDYAVQILSKILSQQAQSILSDYYVKEFISGLQKVDMSRIGADVSSADIITGGPISDAQKEEITKALTGRLNRAVRVNYTQDQTIIGGVLLKFGSLALDGSVKNLIREAAIGSKQKIESE